MRTLAGHHGKAVRPARRARRCLDGGVQRQQIGLEGNAVYHLDDVGHLPCRLVHAVHGADHLLDIGAALARQLARVLGKRAGLAGGVGVVLHRGAELLHGCCRLLPARWPGPRCGRTGHGCPGRSRCWPGGHALGAVAHLGHDGAQPGAHLLLGGDQLTHLVVAMWLVCAAQVAAGHGARQNHGLLHRLGDGAHKGRASNTASVARTARGRAHEPQRALRGAGLLLHQVQ